MAIDPLALDTSVPSGKFVWRSDAEDPDRFLVGERLGRPTVLIPTDDLGCDARLECLACFTRVKLRPSPGAPTPRYVPVGRGGRP